jgi:ribosomal RNA-processing protein 9
VRKSKKESDEAEVKVSTKKSQEENEEISSDSDEETPVQNGVHAELSSDEEHETAQEKRIRLAKKYLQEIERQGEQILKFIIFVSTK